MMVFGLSKDSTDVELRPLPALESDNYKETNDVVSISNSSIPERETWGHKAEFILSCVGYTVGLGNVWRFPYLAYKSGGGAFIIPYLVMLITAGIPMYIMEVSIGQYITEGPIQAWRIICPLTRGIGYSMLMVSWLVCIYYNVIISWVLFYLFSSFAKDVPWRNCDPAWASSECQEKLSVYKGNGSIYNATTGGMYCLKGYFPVYKNALNSSTVVLSGCVASVTANIKRITPASDYFNRYVLNKTDSINEVGPIRWQLALCLLLAWIVVYFCMWKGVKSAGKVVYFTAIFPYVVLVILLIRGLTLPGSAEGIMHYIKPNFTNIAKAEVWGAAGSQLFYSLGPAFGSLLSYGSYNKFKNNCVRDAIFLGFMDIFSSTLAGFVIFSLLGYMALKLQVDISQVVDTGPGLAFVMYPEGIAKMPISPLWAILFFFMLFTLGLDSQFGMMECVVTNFADEYPRYLRKHKEVFIMVICVISYLIGLSMVTQGGVYLFNLFDYQSAGISLIFVALVEMITLGWFFGTERLNAQLEQMIGYKPSYWWTLCWKYFTPSILLMIFIFSCIGWNGISYNGVAYPAWAEVVGWCICLVTVIWIPIFAIKSFFEVEGTLLERLKQVITPNDMVLKEKAKLNGVEYVIASRKLLTDHQVAV